jgi:DNA-binding NarL/FixJ family response regulator
MEGDMAGQPIPTSPRDILVVADKLGLRRQSLTSFLGPWAQSAGLEVLGLDPDDTRPESIETCRLVLINVGTISGCDEFHNWIDWARCLAPQAAIVVVAESDEAEDVLAVLSLGIRGFIPCLDGPGSRFADAHLHPAGGDFFPPTALLNVQDRTGLSLRAPSGAAREAGELTSRQDDVMRLLRLGKPNKVIARELGMQESTVKVHVRQIMRKLGVSNRTEAALLSSASQADVAAKLASARRPAVLRVES